jgi:hypothetical protein
MVVHVRSAWQQLDIQATQALEEQAEVPVSRIGAQYMPAPDERSERISLSLSA